MPHRVMYVVPKQKGGTAYGNEDRVQRQGKGTPGTGKGCRRGTENGPGI